MMRSFLWLLLVDLARVSIQQCTIEVFEDSIALDILQATETTESNQNFVINRTIYNCLSTSRTIGILGSMSVSILYTRSDTPDRLRDVRYDMLCIGSVWMRAAQMLTAFESNDTRIECSRCLNVVNDHHCASCSSSCTGLHQCYGPMASECCSYNDNGNCTDECGMNKEVNSTFHCVCTNFWTGDSCDNCSLLCMNGGIHKSDCSTCACAAGFTGSNCETDIDECSNNPCKHGGTCIDLINGYNCDCKSAFSGPDCSDIIIRFTQSTYRVNEEDGSVQLVLDFSQPAFTNITITVSSIDKSAKGGVDYVSGPFSVTIPAGQANISFDVPITDDNIYEQNEKFKLAIDRSSTPDGVRIGNPRKVTVVIGDNDNCIPCNITRNVAVIGGGAVVATFSSGNPGTTFSCRLDQNITIPCTSPLTYTSLDRGRHRIVVIADCPCRARRDTKRFRFRIR